MSTTLVRLFIILFLVWNTLPAFAADDKEAEGGVKSHNYFELKPSIVANLQKGAKYIRCDIQLMTLSAADNEEIERHSPALRHEMFLLISDQPGNQLKDVKGKEKFRKSALKSMRRVMKELTGREVLEDLFFTSFFVQ